MNLLPNKAINLILEFHTEYKNLGVYQVKKDKVKQLEALIKISCITAELLCMMDISINEINHIVKDEMFNRLLRREEEKNNLN